MLELLTERGMTLAEAERQILDLTEGETEAEKAVRIEAEARAERRRQFDEQQNFLRISPMGLPGMGAKVVSGKRAKG